MSKNEATDQVRKLKISRREFLTYAWAGSMALFAAEGVGAFLWYGLPRSVYNKWGGIFILDSVPELDAMPVKIEEGQFWLSNSADGVIALYEITPRELCVYKWVDANDRFETPCYGSKFKRNGDFIEGPATRHLDRFPMKIKTTNGTFTSNDAGDPIRVNPATVVQVQVDTGRLISGGARPPTLRYR